MNHRAKDARFLCIGNARNLPQGVLAAFPQAPVTVLDNEADPRVSMNDVPVGVDAKVARVPFLGKFHNDQATVHGGPGCLAVIAHQTQQLRLSIATIVASIGHSDKISPIDTCTFK